MQKISQEPIDEPVRDNKTKERKSRQATVLVRILAVPVGLNNKETIYNFIPIADDHDSKYPDAGRYEHDLKNMRLKWSRVVETLKSQMYVTSPWHKLTNEDQTAIRHYLQQNKSDDKLNFYPFQEVANTFLDIRGEDYTDGFAMSEPVFKFYKSLPPTVTYVITFGPTKHTQKWLQQELVRNFQHFYNAGDPKLVLEKIKWR